MRGHALVVFDIVQVKPQRLERAYLAYGLGLVQLANDPHFVLGPSCVARSHMPV